MSLTLWGRRNSSNVQKALWALEEMGVAYEHIRVGGSFGETDNAAYRAMNPNGLAPVLRDGDLVLFESDAILRHLAGTRGPGGLWPEDPAQQARADMWITWNTTTLYAAVVIPFFAMVRTPRAEQKPDALGPAAETLAKAAATLDAALDGRAHLLGDAFTAADIPAAISLNRAMKLPVGAPDAAAIPNAMRWLESIRARPVFRRHIDQPIGACLEDWLAIEQERG